LKRLEKAEHKTKSEAGEKLTKNELEHVLDGLGDAPVDVKHAAAAWLLKNSAEFERFSLKDKAARTTLSGFVEAQATAMREPASSPIATRTTTGKPPKLDADTKTAISDGLDLAVRRDEVSFRKAPKAPSPNDYFPAVNMKLDAGDGTKIYAVYLSKKTGIDHDETKTSDVKKTIRFVLVDVETGKSTTDIQMLRGADPNASTGIGRPGGTMTLSGKDLPSKVTDALDESYDLMIRRDEGSWRAGAEPKASDHFLPPYKMEVRDPDSRKMIEVEVFFSKRATLAFGHEPTKVEDAQQATLRDPATGRNFSGVRFSLPPDNWDWDA